jgi:tetratricopeptide (TPR) repeat protein
VRYPPLHEQIAALFQTTGGVEGNVRLTDMSSNKENESQVLSGNRKQSSYLTHLAIASKLTDRNQWVEDEFVQQSRTPTVATKANNAAVTTPDALDFFRRGVEKLDRGDDRAAIEDFNQALRLNPHFAEAYSHRGTIRHDRGDYHGAIQDYNQVLRIYPQHAETYSNRGMARATLGDRWGAIQDFNQALEIDANCAQAYLNRGHARMELEDFAGAIADCNAVLSIHPNRVNNAIVTGLQALAFLNRGYARMQLEDYPGAIADFNQTVQMNPDLAEAYFNRGLSQALQENYQGAIADFDRSIEMNPNYAQAYLNRGYTRMQMGDNWGSIQDFDRAKQIAPASAQAFFQQITHTLNQEEEVVEDSDRQLIKGLIVQGNVRYELGDYHSAIEAYTEVLKLDPNNTEAYNRRSTARSAIGDYQGAMEDLEKATNLLLSNEQLLQPMPEATVQKTAQDYHHDGLNKLQTGDLHGALEDLSQAIELNGNDATAYTCRGVVHRRLGNHQSAVADLQQAAKLFFEQGDAKSAQHVIETLKKLQS